MTLLTLGEPLICFDSGDEPLDATPTVRKYVVGAECNVAIGLARLGHRVSYLGKIGDDSLGREVVRTLRGEGVDVSLLTVRPHADTGILLKERARSGRTAVTYHRAGSAGSTLSVDDLPTEFDHVDRLHVTGITLHLSASARSAALEAMHRTRDAGGRVSLDANFRRKLASESELAESFHEAARLADEVFIGTAEAALCAGSDDDAAIDRFARGLAVETVIVKGRGGGARAYTNGEVIEVAAIPVPVVDAVGAGDGFAAGYLHARLEGGSIRDGLVTGGLVAAKVIGRRSDNDGLPYRDEMVAASDTSTGVAR